MGEQQTLWGLVHFVGAFLVDHQGAIDELCRHFSAGVEQGKVHEQGARGRFQCHLNLWDAFDFNHAVGVAVQVRTHFHVHNNRPHFTTR
jgi:hypothetical protein